MNHHDTQQNEEGILLPGLDGTNPLGFLAALGLIRSIAHVSEHPGASRLWWTPQNGTWVAKVRLVDNPRAGADELLASLSAVLSDASPNHPARRWTTFTDGSPGEIRQLIADTLDPWSGCIGIEPLPGTDDAKRLSQLQTARKDYHVKAIDNLLKGVSREQLERTLFSDWTYSDPLEGLTLHLDPTEDRRHAYQWNQPAGDPDRKTHGNMTAANRLALEAFAFFPVVHTGTMSQTLGFRGHFARDTYWTWPLWGHPANACVIQTLLGLPDLQETDPANETRKRLQARGIAAVMRTRRILVGKTPNLTPPRQIA